MPRPRSDDPRVSVSLRLPQSVLAEWEEGGPDWRARMEDRLIGDSGAGGLALAPDLLAKASLWGEERNLTRDRAVSALVALGLRGGAAQVPVSDDPKPQPPRKSAASGVTIQKAGKARYVEPRGDTYPDWMKGKK